MRTVTCCLALALSSTALSRPALAAWTRDAAGACRHQWSSDDLARGPAAMLNAPLAPYRSAAGAIHWILRDDPTPHSTAALVLLVPLLGGLGGGAGLIDTGAWLFTGLADTLTGGAFAIAPPEAAHLSVAPLAPFFVPTAVAASQQAQAPCGAP